MAPARQLTLFAPVRPGARVLPLPAARPGLCRDCGELPRLPMWKTCEVCWRSRRAAIHTITELAA